MIRSIIISALVFGGAFVLSNQHVGYPHIGPQYVKKQAEIRKSVRTGSMIYGAHRSGSFRTGK